VAEASAILAIETSTDYGEVAVKTADGRVGAAELAERRSHGRDLLPTIDALVTRMALRREDLGVVAVSLGPGSYTGLRVGAATGQGIALALGIPCAGVQTAQVIAANVKPASGELAVVLDVRGGEVFVRLFGAADERWRPEGRWRVVSPQEAAQVIPAPSPGAAKPRATRLVDLAETAAREGLLRDPAELIPFYPRPSTAEINLRKAGKL